MKILQKLQKSAKSKWEWVRYIVKSGWVQLKPVSFLQDFSASYICSSVMQIFRSKGEQHFLIFPQEKFFLSTKKHMELVTVELTCINAGLDDF